MSAICHGLCAPVNSHNRYVRSNGFFKPNHRALNVVPRKLKAPHAADPAKDPEPQPGTAGVSGDVGPVTSAPTATFAQRAFRNPPAWTGFLGTLLASGALTGTLLDGIHSRTYLQVYDMFPLELGPLHSSWVVPPLLGLFYLVLGSMFAVTDNLLEGDAATSAVIERCRNSDFVAAAFGTLAAQLQLSAWLYSSDTPYWQISLILATTSALTWKFFDGTKHGAALALFCAVAAPASELLILQVVPLWHYSKPDFLGFVSWVPWCYCFYTPVLGALARNVWANARDPTAGPGEAPMP